MWLIDTSNLKLKNFPNSDQRYAILSHTWGADGDEVSLQEMIADPIADETKGKSGFLKIVRTCEIARTKHGLQWAWVDTCCIDKTSSAELSEAINSMFRWYKEAEICIAFLYDFTEKWSSLDQSKWFTRGWTLQELIAPKWVEFYDNTWELRGTRSTLQIRISRITGIFAAVLTQTAILDQIPIAARMSWASMRQTSRKEDLAYCLLGLFDINMPMLYGEGEKAFVRLQEEIIKQNADMSIFLWKDSLDDRSFSGLLAKSPLEFRDMGGITANIDLRPANYQITNRGIRFETQICLSGSGFAFLSLGHGNSAIPLMAIRLQKIGEDSFVRASFDVVASFPTHPDRELIHGDFFVAKTLTSHQSRYLESNALRFSEIAQVDYALPNFELVQSEPQGCFNRDTGLFYAPLNGIIVGLLELKMFAYPSFRVLIDVSNVMQRVAFLTAALFPVNVPQWERKTIQSPWIDTVRTPSSIILRHESERKRSVKITLNFMGPHSMLLEGEETDNVTYAQPQILLQWEESIDKSALKFWHSGSSTELT